HLFDESRLRPTHIFDRLARDRLRQKADEIAGVTGLERDADLAVVLHAADARTMAGTRVEYDEGSLLGVDLDSGRRNDPHENVIDGPLEAASVRYELEFEIQNVWILSGHVREMIVATPAQRIQEQHEALARIDPIVPSLLRQVHPRAHRRPRPSAALGRTKWLQRRCGG